MTDEKWRYVLSAEGREIELSDGEVTLGRSRTSTVRLEHESVSRSHALLTFDRGEAVVKDLNSSNGTFVGGKRISRETRLVNGDRLQLGAAVIEVRLVPPNVPSERTALMAPDQLPDAPPPIAPRAPSGITYEHDASPGPASPGAAPGPALAPDPLSASELFRSVDRAPENPSLVVDVFPPPPGGPADEVSTIPPPILPPEPAAPARELADVSLRHADLEKAAKAPLSDRAASFRDRRAPTLNAGPRNAASPFARLLAALVDSVILAAINVVLFAPVVLVKYFSAELQTHDTAPDWAFRSIFGLAVLLAFLANVLYVVGGWAWRGRTPGKSLLGLAVVKRGTLGGRVGIGWGPAFVRAVVLVLAGLPLGLGWIWAFFEKERRAFQDLAAGTWVVRVR